MPTDKASQFLTWHGTAEGDSREGAGAVVCTLNHSTADGLQQQYTHNRQSASYLTWLRFVNGVAAYLLLSLRYRLDQTGATRYCQVLVLHCRSKDCTVTALYCTPICDNTTCS